MYFRHTCWIIIVMFPVFLPVGFASMWNSKFGTVHVLMQCACPRVVVMVIMMDPPLMGGINLTPKGQIKHTAAPVQQLRNEMFVLCCLLWVFLHTFVSVVRHFCVSEVFCTSLVFSWRVYCGLSLFIYFVSVGGVVMCVVLLWVFLLRGSSCRQLLVFQWKCYYNESFWRLKARMIYYRSLPSVLHESSWQCRLEPLHPSAARFWSPTLFHPLWMQRCPLENNHIWMISATGSFKASWLALVI